MHRNWMHWTYGAETEKAFLAQYSVGDKVGNRVAIRQSEIAVIIRLSFLLRNEL